MYRTLLPVAIAGLAAGQQIVDFKDHTIESHIPGGFTVIVVDVNHDGNPDVIGTTQQLPNLSWYEDPTWQPHLMVKDVPAMVNLASYDIDGDGYPEVAIESAFSMNASKSEGLVWLLSHQGDPRQPWKATRIDAVATSHHIARADIDGDGRKELINAPLIGATNLRPKYQGKTPLFSYRVPEDRSSEMETCPDRRRP